MGGGGGGGLEELRNNCSIHFPHFTASSISDATNYQSKSKPQITGGDNEILMNLDCNR